MTEGPHDADGYYTCPCGTDRNGQPYCRRSLMHIHGHPDPEANRTEADPCGCWRQYDRHSVSPVATYTCRAHMDGDDEVLWP